MANVALSAGYKALAQGLVYDFKSESGEIKNAKWTPHNVKTLYITSKGIIAKGYSSALPVTKSQDGLIKFESSNPDDYTDMLLALFKLERGMSADVSNITDIILVLGSSNLALPFSNAQDALRVLGYSRKNQGKNGSVEEYAENSSVFTLPAISCVDCNNIATDYIGNKNRSIAKAEIIKRALQNTPVQLQDVKLQETEGVLAWTVIPDSKYVQRDPTQSVFPLDDKRTAFTKLSNLIREADVLRCFGSKFNIKVLYAANYEPFDVSIPKFTTNAGNYPIDTELWRFMHDNYYKPMAVYEYLLGKQENPDDKLVKYVKESVTSANELLFALVNAAKSARMTEANWTKVSTMSNFRDILQSLSAVKNIDLTKDLDLLLSKWATGTVDTQDSVSPAVLKVLGSLYVDSVLIFVQSAIVIDLFSFGYTPGTKPANSFYPCVDTMLVTFGVSTLYLSDLPLLSNCAAHLLGLDDNAASDEIHKVLNKLCDNKHVKAMSSDISQSEQFSGFRAFIAVMKSGI